jgi:hypothetical protein
MRIITVLLLALACDIPSQEEIREEVDRAADDVERRVASGTVLIVAACAEAAAAFADCRNEQERLATEILYRLGCVEPDGGGWDCSNSAFCGGATP